MKKLESGFGANNDALPLYENKNVVDWKLINNKVDSIIGKENDENKNTNPEALIVNNNRAWKSLDEKGEDQTENDRINAAELIEKTEKEMARICGESAWSCFADDGQ